MHAALMFQPTFGHNFRQKRYENELNCSIYCRNIFSFYIYESPKSMHGTRLVPQWIMQNLRQCWQIGTFAMRFEWNQKNPKWLLGFYGRSNKNLVFHLEFVWNGMKERPCYVQHSVDHGPWWFGSWVKRIIPSRSTQWVEASAHEYECISWQLVWSSIRSALHVFSG